MPRQSANQCCYEKEMGATEEGGEQMTLPSITNRLFMTIPEPQSNDPQRFYLVTEGPKEENGQVIWYCIVRYGIYPQTGHYKVFKDKAALEQELKTKELEGYTLVSDTNYGMLADNWLIDVKLRGTPQ